MKSSPGAPPNAVSQKYTYAPYSTQFNSVGPLCTTFWAQGNPFNIDCPTYIDNNGLTQHDPAGCVPVAMAQVMNFWKASSNYNFKIMPVGTESYASNVAGYNEIARLLHDIGITSNNVPNQDFVSYGTSESSANDAYCPLVFTQFGIFSSQRTESISNQELSGQNEGTYFSSLLNNEVFNNNRPCLLGGYTGFNTFLGIYTPTNGHEWVCDGTQSTVVYYFRITTFYDINGNPISSINSAPYVYSSITLLHMNWGWGPFELGGQNNNGWYNEAVDYTNSPDSNGDFQYFQTVIYNIHP